ncbi:MAG: CIA30 family protein [Saprospiraceae bacterium]|nr:CIA30 family protein [Saprospiraceae bacterium]
MTVVNILASILVITGSMTLFDFDAKSDLRNWTIVDDVVMGGRSDGKFKINESGYGQFYGSVSTENYGGFSSVRYYPGRKIIEGKQIVEIRLKGDGKSYQFRTKSNMYDRHSYVYSFDTNGEWETVQIALSDMEPKFRGRQLNMPNYPGKYLEEIAILIGNKRNESFQLEIDYILLK